MKSFNTTNLKTLRAALNAALKNISVTEGITFELGTIRFDDFNAGCKLKMTINNPEATEEKTKLLPKGVEIGKNITIRNTEYKIVDFNPRRWKKPIVIERNSDGMRFVCAYEKNLFD